jgi:hypothetical protein
MEYIYRDTTDMGSKEKNLPGVAINEFQSKVTYRGKKTMKIFELLRKSVFVLMLSFMVTAILPACSSSEESGSGSSCENACYSDEVTDMQVDECLAACQIK